MFSHTEVYTVSQWREDNDALPQRLFASGMYSATLGVCLCMCPESVGTCVHIYVGAYCLSCLYLARRVSSHVQLCADLLNTYSVPPALFVCGTVLARVIFESLFGKGPLCVVSDLNFMAGWVSSAAAAGFKDYPELHSDFFTSQRFHSGSDSPPPFWGFTHTNVVHCTFAPSHGGKESAFWQHKITQNTAMRYLRAVKMFTLENEAVRAEMECSTGGLD